MGECKHVMSVFAGKIKFNRKKNQKYKMKSFIFPLSLCIPQEHRYVYAIVFLYIVDDGWNIEVVDEQKNYLVREISIYFEHQLRNFRISVSQE